MDIKLIKAIDGLKKEIDQFRPLKRDLVNELREYYRIGLTYSSNVIEGNSLTESETKIIIEEGITIGGKLLKDHLEVLGHSDAYDMMYTLSRKKGISESSIKMLHKLFYYRIDQKNAGVYRKKNVFITGTDFVPPKYSDIHQLMKNFVENLKEIHKLYHPVHYAAMVHLNFVTIHPFIDGNGRTARLLMNLALLQEGYPIATIPAILRSNYIASLKQAQTKHTNVSFINFIGEVVYESMKDYARMINAQKG